jgi:hypothetical protein
MEKGFQHILTSSASTRAAPSSPWSTSLTEACHLLSAFERSCSWKYMYALSSQMAAAHVNDRVVWPATHSSTNKQPFHWDQSTNAVKKFGNTMRKRKYADKDHADQELSDGTTIKKARVVRSVDLHQKFVNAVNQIGFDNECSEHRPIYSSFLYL